MFAPLRNYPGITWYGLGGSFYTYNGRRIYYAISNQLITYIGEPEYEVDGEYYDTRLAVMVHEMLHCIETNSNSNGIHGFEAVHDAEQNGYDSGGTGEWFDWYHDLMQDTLKSGKKGFSEESFFIQHPQRILVDGVTISETSLEMESGGTAYLSASVTPENADYQNVVWNTSDPRIVRVSRDGKVTAYYPGKATVYASANNSMITAKCEVTVTGEYPNEIISVDQGYSKFTYNGKVKDPMLMIFNEEAWEDLLEDEQYTVSYSTDRKSIGRHTGTIRFIGKYKGFADRTISFTIVPAKGAFKSVTAGKKNLTIKIKAQKGGVKYKIGIKQKSAKKWKYYTISGTTKTIKNLKSKQQYQVKVQAFKKVDGETYKGSWSKPKTVRIK